MTALLHPAHASTRLAALTGVAARAGAAMAAVFRIWRNRTCLGELATLTDRQLADMGITRGDLFDARGSRWTEDPTRRLRMLRDERLTDAELAARHIH
ncbi:DUF1127 domain-containing protein [Zhengella sp. ZM62]|uniref:DUF1127 domain-containing protein n=1 Tax=Zhengella sedimenti TaxID=3390035 RepID=UPI003976D302